MSSADDYRFTKTHEWARLTEEGLVEVGITDFGQQQLTDIVNVELPEVGDYTFQAGEEMGVVESVKTASDYYAPVAGTIEAVNESLLDSPEKINEDALGEGWIVRIKPTDVEDLESLLTGAEYDSSLPED